MDVLDAAVMLKGSATEIAIWDIRVVKGEMKSNESWIEINGERIRFLEAGNGLPLLLLDGLLGGPFCWRFTMPALAEKYFLYAMDMPGSGLSHARGADCSMSQQAVRLTDFVRRMGWKELGVIGSSFGGGVAMLLAGNIAGFATVRALVLSSPVNPWSSFGSRRIRLLSSRLGGYFLRTVLPISHPVHGIALRRMYGDPRRVPKDALAGYRATILCPGRAQNVLTVLRKWQQDMALLEKTIPKLNIPTLLIWGTQDKAVDPRSRVILKERLPQAELHTIEGAGHLPFEEKPEEFNAVVLEFLARVFPSR